jgi:hypothetical protein
MIYKVLRKIILAEILTFWIKNSKSDKVQNERRWGRTWRGKVAQIT